MARTKRIRGLVEDADQIVMLASPARLEIIMTLEMLPGPATVAELAAQMGRPADGLYYHLHALVDSGLIEEHEEAGDRRYRSMTPRGGRIRLRYKLGKSGNAKAVCRVAAGMLRMAERDFTRAASQTDTAVEGPQRELWVARLRGWVNAAEIAEINRLLAGIVKILDRPRSTRARKLVALTWLLAPLSAKPARRNARAQKPR